MSAYTPDPTSATPHGGEVPVVTKRWCTAVMVPIASFMSLMQVSFAAQQYDPPDARYTWMMFATLMAIVSGFPLIARADHPRAVFWVACAMVVVFPFDPLVALMALTSLLARRADRGMTIRAIAAATAVSVYGQLRDALKPAHASLWHLIFASPGTGPSYGTPLEVPASQATIAVTAAIVALVAVALASLLGLHIRSRAKLSTATAQASEAQTQAQELRSSLDNQQLADAIAAEAHDTLAHSLSLIAVNSSALQAQTIRLARQTASAPQPVRDLAHDIEHKADDIRRQAAGALDEAHSIINMLRNPSDAQLTLFPNDETALTRGSLDAIITDARESGMRLDTWIDIQQLTRLDDAIGKIAYRTIQEGLTNARRHAPGAPVSLEVSVAPQHGVHVHISNPVVDSTGTNVPATRAMPEHVDDADGTPVNGTSAGTRAGTGLPGIAARVRTVRGTCHYGVDERRTFRVDVQLPWVEACGGQTDPAEQTDRGKR